MEEILKDRIAYPENKHQVLINLALRYRIAYQVAYQTGNTYYVNKIKQQIKGYKRK